MKLSKSSLSLLESGIQKAVSKYIGDSKQDFVTDIHLQCDPTSGKLTFFDDDDTELASITIEEWVNYEGENFNESTEQILSAQLNSMKSAGAFDDITIMRPFSFVLVDENKETITELLLMDDDTLLVNDELLKGLDEELDAFLKDLLEN